MRLLRTGLLTLLLLGTATGGAQAATVAAGSAQSCSISPAGALTCWGSDSTGGALGTGADRAEDTADPQPVAGLGSGVTDVSLSVTGGGTSTTGCAVADGAARCWGVNPAGQFGNGTKGNRSNAPVPVSGMESGVTAVSVATSHVCGLQNGGAKCWGTGSNGRLGNGDDAEQLTPVTPVGLGSGVVAIAAGWRHTCAIKGGEILCWGDNSNSQLGYDGSNEDAPQPLENPPPGVPVELVAGSDVTCVRTDAGAVYCWGSNTGGKLGAGSDEGKSLDPLAVSGMDSGVSSLAANSTHLCAIRSGIGYCWGDGQVGKLGNGPASAQGNDSNVPVQVRDLTGLTAIAVGGSHTCAIAGGERYCWGGNGDLQLGTDQIESWSGVPVKATGMTPKPPPPAPSPKPSPSSPPTTPPPAVTPAVATVKARASAKLSKSRVAKLATIGCPAGSACRVSAPKTVRVRIRGKRFTGKVLGRGAIRAGASKSLRVSFTKRAVKRLKHATVTVKLSITTTVDGVARKRTIKVKVKRA